MITRAQWGARPPRSTGNKIGAHPKGVAIHWEGPKLGTRPHAACAPLVRSIQTFHMDTRGYVDVAYNFLVCEHGGLYEGRGVGKGSAANGTTGANLDYYAVCGLVGVGDVVSALLKDGLRDGVNTCRAAGAGSAIVGHRDLFATACPGPVLYAWVKAGMPVPPTKPTPTKPTPPEVDMPLTQADADLIVHTLLVTNLGSSGPNVAVALQRAAGIDLPALAKQIAALVPTGGGAVTQPQLEAALRSVLGSVDGK